MLDKLNEAVADYQKKWQALIAKTNDTDFFENQKPTAAAWKTTNLKELLGYFDELRDKCDQIHFGWVNERWLVTLHLKDEKLAWGISIIKLMQRRPGSTDAVGLDHIDFHSSRNGNASAVLKDNSSLKWTHEKNNKHCSWISIWFANTEAKLRTDTVLDPCIAELQETKDKILAA